jgi:SAM-dependent methyltransferase
MISPDQWGTDFFARANEALYRWRTEGPFIADRERELFALLAEGLTAPRRLLAVGLGEGADCCFLEELWPGAEYVGLDLFAHNLAFARHHHPRWRLVTGDALHLPLADGCCDLVLSKDLLHHVPDPVQVLGEMWRVCRPGGQVGVIEVCGQNPVSCLLALAARHERGVLRNTSTRLREWLRRATGQEPICRMAQPLPLWRVAFHYRFGSPALQDSRWARGLVCGLERACAPVVGERHHFYGVFAVAKPPDASETGLG